MVPEYPVTTDAFQSIDLHPHLLVFRGNPRIAQLAPCTFDLRPEHHRFPLADKQTNLSFRVGQGGIRSARKAQSSAIPVFLCVVISAEISPKNKCSLMNAQFKAVGAIALAAWIGLYPHDSEGKDTFTSREFLTWPADSQGFYFRTSIAMAGLIAGQNGKSQGDCISNWYFRNEASAQRQLKSAMERFPQFHPRGVILAMIEKKCGSMTYR